ncbi:MAG: stage II sporulation protein D, partial [Oscillospiraceae bacterium]
YVTAIQVGNKTIHGKELRSILELRSSDFDISYSDTQFIFTVYGYGHGIGMSQYGAEHMALQGNSCEDILSHYFLGVNFVSIDNVLK